MAQKKTKRAGPGRPYEGGERPMIGLRLSESDIAEIDALAEHEGVKRSEMIRRLLDLGRKALRR